MHHNLQARFLALAVVALVGLSVPALGSYSLVWSDEFNGTTLDTSNWNIDIGNGCPSLCGWGNNELEYYRAENVSVSGGNLVLTAKSSRFSTNGSSGDHRCPRRRRSWESSA